MKGDSVSIGTLASNNCFCHRNVFKNGIITFSKMLTISYQKAQNFAHFLLYHFVQISQACGPYTYQIMYGETLGLQCQRQ